MAVNAHDRYDTRETRTPSVRESELFSRLPAVLRKAMEMPGYAEQLRGVDPEEITSRAGFAKLVDDVNQ